MDRLLASVAFVCLLLASGCAARNVNPPSAKPQTGYLDFYADDTSPLCWQIQRVDGNGHKAKTIFEQFKPITEGIVRLAFAPGAYQLRVTMLNRAIPEPRTVEAVVEDGKITPVRITLVETGKTMVETRETRVGGTFYGRTGRSTKMRVAEEGIFRIDAEAQDPLPYRPKVQMPYANAEQETNQ